MRGIVYGIGVGPGDPELITLKAIRLIEQADIIALPSKGADRDITALEIVRQVVDLHDKELIGLPMPMTKDEEILKASHEQGAAILVNLLQQGKTVCFLTLGDPTIYSTYIYLHQRVLAAGYLAQLVPGVPSFCAVAAKLNWGLVERDEILHVIPGTYNSEDFSYLEWAGTKVIMKAGKSVGALKQEIYARGLRENTGMVECCGMPAERVYKNLDDLDENSSYFSLVVVKEGKD